MSRKKHGNFIVVGLGTFGQTVATELARFNDHVLGIDIDSYKVNKLADLVTEVIIADGRDEDALMEAGAANYDVALVAIGEDLEANILCTMNLKHLGVPRIWVKAVNRVHQRILSKLGVDKIIQPELEIGQHIAQMLHYPQVHDYISIGDGHYMVDYTVPSALDGKKLASLKLQDRFLIRCLGILRSRMFYPCDAEETLLQTEDKLLLLGDRKHLKAFGDSMNGRN